MRLVERYIFRTGLGAFLAMVVALTAIIWITQALRQFDLLTTKGQTLVLFLTLTGLIIPSLVTIIAPVALFLAVIYTLNKLNGDSELIVMTASGATVWYFARPLLVLATIVSIGVLFFNLYVLPWSARALNEMFTQLRTDLIGQVLQPGKFSNPEPGLIFHIRDRDSRTGRILGLVMHDTREEGQVATYLAERGHIVKQGSDAFLIMNDGHIIRQNKDNPVPQIILFESYIVDLVRFKPKEAGAELPRPRERYIADLMNPSEKDLALPPVWISKIRSELHDRLSAPIYPFVFVMIVIAAVGVAQTTRQNRAKNLMAAFALAAGLRIAGFGAINVAGASANGPVMVYVIPLAALVVATLAAAMKMRPRRKSRLWAMLAGRFEQAAAWRPRGPRIASGTVPRAASMPAE